MWRTDKHYYCHDCGAPFFKKNEHHIYCNECCNFAGLPMGNAELQPYSVPIWQIIYFTIGVIMVVYAIVKLIKLAI